MNRNEIRTDGFSNPKSEALYRNRWKGEPELQRQYELGAQCGWCSFFAPLNSDYGLCCHKKSRHHLETVFEHFTCPVLVKENWDSHSFLEDPKKNWGTVGVH